MTCGRGLPATRLGTTLGAPPVLRARAQLFDVDALEAAQIDADRGRAVGPGALGITFNAALGAETMVQSLLVELVVALLGLVGGQFELGLGREGPDRAEPGADRAVAFHRLRRIDLDGVGDGAAMAASRIGLSVGHDVLLDFGCRS